MAAHHHDHQLLDEISPRKDNITMASSSSLCYSNVVSHPLAVTHLQSFDSNPEIYDLDNSGIQMIGFQPNPQNIHHHHEQNQFLMVTSQEQQQRQQQQLSFMDDSSTKPCVFPCEENNERPSQGLSLSLSSSNPSTISLQSIELRHHHNHTQRLSLSSPLSNSRDGFLDKSESFHHQPQQEYQDLFAKIIMGGCGSTTSSSIMNLELMKNSKYMGPAQDLLNEFCNLRSRQNPDYPKGKKLQLSKNKENLVDDDSITNNNNYNNASSSSTKDANSSLYDINLLDLHKRNTKLTCMLEELDRRYKHYCEQMKVVVSSFDAVVGPGSANVYSDLASKAMSMHFRCLRDTILAQIKATKKTIVEKDPSNASVLETTKGETPRLRILDQNLRKKRAYQQITMLENHPWRPQRGLPEHSVSVLRAWLFEHFLHPYPSDVDKHILARQTGLTRGQVSNWFINARVRLWKPMVEQMYLAETKEEQDTMGPTSDADYNHPSSGHLCGGFMQPPPPHLKQDPDQLTRFDPDPLSSIVNTNTMASTSRTDPSNMTSVLRSQQSGQFIDGFGSVYHLDFPSSSHNQQHHTSNYGVTTQNDNNTPRKGFAGGNGGGNNVSLTLGLQQLSGNGVSLAFSPTSRTTSLLYPRDHIEDCQQVHQYSLLDGD